MEKKKKKKIFILTVLILSMIYYVGWVFYISEPKYINYSYKKLEQFDYVSLPEHSYDNEVINGIVLQVDNKKALIKLPNHFLMSSEYREVTLGSGYRIIGRGTIYHKVNNYVGFNIMFITQFIIIVLLLILTNSTFKLLKDLDIF